MRSAPLLFSLSLASVLGAAAYLHYTAGSEPVSQSPEHTRITETGALHRFPVETAPSKGDKEKEAPAPALSLTASDGTGLTLASLDSRGVIEGPLAYTELRLVFDNPEGRQLEGTFRITLPQGAAISRFAMKQGDTWQEGEVVEKQRARQVYEDFLHRRQDPALLEQAAGNEFSARVFPIPARGRKELIVSYSQELTPEAPYQVPLRGLPAVGKLDAVVTGSGDDAPILGQLHLTQAAPDRDLRVEPSRLPPGDGVKAGELTLLRVRPAAEAGQDPIASAVIMVDTSASRALGFEAQVALVEQVAAGLGVAPLVVAAFDQGIDLVYEGPASGFAQSGGVKLRERQALGASDLEAALGWARQQAQSRKARRVVLVTDGVPTLGATEPGRLQEAAKRLKNAGVERLDAVAVGGIRDDATLRGMCTAGLDRNGVVIDGARGGEEALRRLSAATRTVEVKVEGADWQWPEKLEGFQPGDEALVYAKMKPGVAPRISLGGRTQGPLTLKEIDRPLLERAWVSAKISQLVQKPASGESEEAVKNEIIQLSTSFRVLSPYTALLVLESENDYARYKIDRKALADILTVEGTKLVRQKRSDGTPPADARPASPATTTVTKSDGVVLKAPPAPPTQETDRDKGGRADNREGGARERRNLEEMQRNLGAAKDEASSAQMRAAMATAAAAAPAPMAAEPSKPTAAMSPPRAPGRASPGDPLADLDVSPIGAMKQAGGGLGPGVGGIGSLGHGSGSGSSGASLGAANGSLAGDSKKKESAPKRAPARLASPDRNENMPSQPAAKVRPATSAAPDAAPLSLADALGAIARDPSPSRPAPPAPPPPPASFGPYEGPLAEVMRLLAQGDKAAALDRALAFRRASPGDVLAFIALGEVFEALGETRSAARAYGSIIDLFSSRADLRRMAGERLERLAAPSAQSLAADSFARAVEQRPDHPSSHRLLAYARLRAGDFAGAFDAIEAGAKRSYPENRFRGADRILREDMGLIGAAWVHADRWKRGAIEARLAAAGSELETGPSLRFVLVWETDNNDVDFHIHDSHRGHAYYGSKTLASGGTLYEDVTTGYGPECFTIRKDAAARAAPYKLEAQYYSRGPMGYGMGKLEIIDHDGDGTLTFEERPFVIMQDRAFVDMGSFPALDEKTAPKTAPGELPRP
jgi:tetratricopeptide (TPR) repeat protein